jgi:hypothetical protein
VGLFALIAIQIAGEHRWIWLAGEFDLERIADVVGNAMDVSWQTWNELMRPCQQAAFTQLVMHVMLQRPVTRAGAVPGTNFSWQELEAVGMAYLTRRCASLLPHHSLPWQCGRPMVANFRAVSAAQFV